MSTQKQSTKYKEFVHKPRKARARELLDNEVVNCYNGVRIGQKGDYVVVDEECRTMIIRKDRFENNYVEAKE